VSIPAVIYAAKSTEDVKGSIPTQLKDCRVEIEGLGGREIVAEHTDEAKSAYHGNRGVGLAAAKAAAERAAKEHGGAELWVIHSDRLARGDGRTAAHLVEHVLWAFKTDVTLRSVEDDDACRDLLYAAVNGQRNHEDSKRKSSATRAGKRRRAERGERIGGKVPDGYLAVRTIDGHGRVSVEDVIDRDRSPVIELMFAYTEEGLASNKVARRLNREGHRTKTGRPWEAWMVRQMVTNPYYAGRVVVPRTQRREWVEGRHSALIEPARWERIQRIRDDVAARNPGSWAHKEKSTTVGRPSRNHALASLATCARCGSRMIGETSSRPRKDGSRKRSYVCVLVHGSSGACDMPRLDAALVDAWVVEKLPELLSDFNAWRERLMDRHATDRERLEGEVATAEESLVATARGVMPIEQKWASYVEQGRDRDAEMVLPILQRKRDEVAMAERRLQAARDALASVPENAPVDAMLDWISALRNAIAGRLDDTGSMYEVNQALRELFDAFLLDATPSVHMRDGQARATTQATCVVAQPILASGVAHALAELVSPELIEPNSDAPPMSLLWPLGEQGPEGQAPEPGAPGGGHAPKTPSARRCIWSFADAGIAHGVGLPGLTIGNDAVSGRPDGGAAGP
jgi:DNA invertase Pin-like site-specific DNA recombinase